MAKIGRLQLRLRIRQKPNPMKRDLAWYWAWHNCAYMVSRKPLTLIHSHGIHRYSYTAKQKSSHMCDRSQNLPSLAENDMTWQDVINRWPDMTSTWNFQSMYQIDQWEGTGSFRAIRRVLRESFAKRTLVGLFGVCVMYLVYVVCDD